MNRLYAALLVLALTAACARPPKLSASVTAKRKSGDVVSLVVTVKNLENRATTPILVEVTAEMHTANGWSKPESVIHPAAFVLNRNEERSIIENIRTDATELRTTLVLKEAETGHLIKTEKSLTRVGA